MTQNKNKKRLSASADAALSDFKGTTSSSQVDHFITVINKARDYWQEAFRSLSLEQKSDEDEFPLPNGHDPVDLFLCRLFTFVNTYFRTQAPKHPDEGGNLVYWEEGEHNVPDYYPGTYCLHDADNCDQVTLIIYDDPDGHLRSGEWDEYAKWYGDQTYNYGFFKTRDGDYTPILTMFMGLNDSVPVVLGDDSWGIVDAGDICSGDVQDRFTWLFSAWVADQHAKGNFDESANFASTWPLLADWYGAVTYAATLIKDPKDRWTIFDSDSVFTFLTKFNNDVKYYTKRTDDNNNSEVIDGE